MGTPDRLHALDAVRGFALLLGIVLHATMSFFLVIPAQDVSQSTVLAVTFYVIHIFRMSLFYVIAGFFAHRLFHRRGLRGFVKDRATRIVVPMTVGWIVLAPPTIAAVVWGLSRSFPDGVPDAIAGAAPDGLPLLHLWFLYYLCVFYVLALGVRAGFVALIDRSGAVRVRIDALIGALLVHRVAPFVLAVPAFAVLFLDAAWPVWFGIPSPETGLLPQWPALIAFGTAFAFGWVLDRQAGLLDVLARQWRVHLVLAVGLTAACLAIVGPPPGSEASAATAIEGGTGMRLLYTACYTVSVWCWIFGLIGAALRFCANASPVRRYLADSAYWLYLAHVPLVFGLQAWLAPMPMHWSIKFPLIVAITLVVLLATYHGLVRPTVVGEILNGRKVPRASGLAPIPRHAPARLPSIDRGRLHTDTESAPVAVLHAVTKRYGKTLALDGVSLAVRPGELLAVLGPNGAGKSTAIGLWLGTIEADSGTVEVMGGSPRDANSRLGVGVMLQDVALPPELRAPEQIELVASYYRDPRTVDETITVAGIAPFADKRYGKLSGGQKRQVQFATAVCGRPRLLFLDEPTVGLDVEARAAMWRTIRRLRGEGCAIVLTTHYLEEAEALADRVVVLARGQVIAEGSVAEMRALVSRKRIRCASTIEPGDILQWPGVIDAGRESGILHITAVDAESVVQRLFAVDPALRQLEVRQASLADAFTELTKEAA